METLNKVDQNKPQISVDKFDKMRSSLLKSNASTEDLL